MPEKTKTDDRVNETSAGGRIYKIPVSVLVIIHTARLEVLLLERAAHPGFWQSVTGSLEPGETPIEAARREVGEETGIAATLALHDWRQCNRYEIMPQWRDRYAPGVGLNTEHVFSLCIEQPLQVVLAPDEHRAYCWLPWKDAAQRCFSPSNRDAILQLPDISCSGKK